jgi:hypothetical protein
VLIPLSIGDRVATDDGRTGVVKWLDYGGVHVELDPTDEEGRELRVYHVDSLEVM